MIILEKFEKMRIAGNLAARTLDMLTKLSLGYNRLHR